MKSKLLSGVIAALFVASPALAFEPFVVKDIRIEGIQRTEAGTVFSYLPVKVGEQFTDDKASQAIKALFATGFFKDVRIEVERDVIVVVLDERPAISQVDFVGIKEFDKEALKKGLKEVGLAESRIFDRAVLERAEQELGTIAVELYSNSISTTSCVSFARMSRQRCACSRSVRTSSAISSWSASSASRFQASTSVCLRQPASTKPQ